MAVTSVSRVVTLFIVLLIPCMRQGYAAEKPDDCCTAPKAMPRVAAVNRLQTKVFSPRIELDRPHLGPAKARVTIVEYGDFQCPFTNRSRDAVQKVLERHPSDVRFFFKVLPLGIHGKVASLAAQYFEAASAAEPKQAWAYFNALFDNQQLIRDQDEPLLRTLAAAEHIDLTTLDEELGDTSVRGYVLADIREAQAFGFGGTPTFLINGRRFDGLASPEDLEQLVASALR